MHTFPDRSKAPILVIAAHPDDELLGAGATFAKRARQGHEVHVVILCEGATGRANPKNRQGAHTEGARAAADIIGFSSIENLNLPDQRLDTLSQLDINKRLEAVMDKIRPAVVYTHFRGDINRDHQVAHDCVMVAVRPFRETIREVLAFETPSSTGWLPGPSFEPDTFEVVDEWLDLKLEAMACYETETPPLPHPRSIESLRHRAHYWGSQVNRVAAEPFMTLRRICQ